jgi:AbrB family looped-hinge helix DNA binding protein
MKETPDPEVGKQFTVELGDRGRVVLPAPVRRQLGLREGDELILTVAEGSIIQLASRRRLARKFRGVYQRLASRKSLVNELILGRRKEDSREQ